MTRNQPNTIEDHCLQLALDVGLGHNVQKQAVQKLKLNELPIQQDIELERRTVPPHRRRRRKWP